MVPDSFDPEAERRLQVLEHHTELGAGYRIALKDLEMRGAGNLLGAEQSGFVHAVGGNVKNTVVPFMNGRLNLLQALAAAGYGYRDAAQGRLADTRIIRSVGDHGEFFVVDAERMLAGEVGPFELVPGDVIFVPPTGVTNWNEALAQLLPSLQTISGLLTPFVQIKFLSQ